MSHTPPTPAAQQSPYPLHPEPHPPAPPRAAVEPKVAKTGPGGTALGVGAAIGIGSAALVAALLYARKNREEPKAAKKKKKRDAED